MDNLLVFAIVCITGGIAAGMLAGYLLSGWCEKQERDLEKRAAGLRGATSDLESEFQACRAELSRVAMQRDAAVLALDPEKRAAALESGKGVEKHSPSVCGLARVLNVRSMEAICYYPGKWAGIVWRSTALEFIRGWKAQR